jgi:hypothetical protein
MRRTVIGWAAAGLVVAGGCVSGGGGSGEAAGPAESTTTTSPAPDSPNPEEPEGPEGPEGDVVSSGDECGEPPIWAAKAVRSPDGPAVDGDDEEQDADQDGEAGGAGESTECQEEEGPELGTGDVQITLRWESDADLDLHVVEPNGEEISFTDPGPTATGGELDVDSNVGCQNDGSVENVFWAEGDMPLGDYTVRVHGFSVEGCGGGDYTLTASVQGEEVLHETGSVGEGEEDAYGFEAS